VIARAILQCDDMWGKKKDGNVRARLEQSISMGKMKEIETEERK